MHIRWFKKNIICTCMYMSMERANSGENSINKKYITTINIMYWICEWYYEYKQSHINVPHTFTHNYWYRLCELISWQLSHYTLFPCVIPIFPVINFLLVCSRVLYYSTVLFLWVLLWWCYRWWLYSHMNYCIFVCDTFARSTKLSTSMYTTV